MVLPLLEYCAAFSIRCASAFEVSRGSISTSASDIRRNLQGAAIEHAPEPRRRGIHDVGWRHPIALGGDSRGVDPRHVKDVLKHAIQPVQFGQAPAADCACRSLSVASVR